VKTFNLEIIGRRFSVEKFAICFLCRRVRPSANVINASGRALLMAENALAKSLDSRTNAAGIPCVGQCWRRVKLLEELFAEEDAGGDDEEGDEPPDSDEPE
jgi:hypothetical protein